MFSSKRFSCETTSSAGGKEKDGDVDIAREREGN